jgi:hypothetical protein
MILVDRATTRPHLAVNPDLTEITRCGLGPSHHRSASRRLPGTGPAVNRGHGGPLLRLHHHVTGPAANPGRVRPLRPFNRTLRTSRLILARIHGRTALH